MKQINLKLTGEQYLGEAVVLIDGKQAKFTKNQFGNLVLNHQTENDKIKLEVHKLLDVGGFFWFITQLFFFIITIFGILDIHSKKKYITLIYEAEIELKEENNILLRCNYPKDNAQAFEVETDLSVNEGKNKFFVDEKARKIFKGLLIAKIILALAIIASVTAVLIVKL